MEIKIGKMNELVVTRITDLGYMLSDGKEEVLLHFGQASEELKIDETIEVFIFQDSKKRLTATMQKPFLQIDEPGFTTVIDVIPSLGVFIDNNIPKDHLISKDDLPYDIEKWPDIGDTVLCKLKLTKTQLISKLITPEEAKLIFKPTTKLSKFQKIDAIVLKSGNEGVNLISLEGHNIFVYYKHKRKEYRIGEKVTVTINNIRENNHYNGTLLEAKVPLMKNDADIILNYLRENNNYMPITSKTDIETIEQNFKMSKAAFKRALGNLYKQRLIEFKDDGTYLIK